MRIFRESVFNKRLSCYIKTVLIIVVLGSISSCKKFLSEYSQNQAFLKSVGDLNEILVGECYTSVSPDTWAHFLDDDADENPSEVFVEGNYPEFFYLRQWQPNPFINTRGIQVDDNIFRFFYRRISALNTILLNASDLREKGAAEKDLQQVRGEAYFLRAYYYFFLVNIYGKPYRSASANTDYGIPLKTDPAAEDGTFTRASVKKVYDQIISDLKQAEKDFSMLAKQEAVRASQEAVQALLSRVFLFEEDYEQSIVYADKIIAKQYQLADLNKYTMGTSFLSMSSSETIFAMPAYGYSSLYFLMQPSSGYTGFDNSRVSTDLTSIFSEKDLRKPFFFELSNGESLVRKAGIAPDLVMEFNIRLAEIYLNKAEAQAASGLEEQAKQTLQELRKNRFAPDDLTTITETGAALVNFIREERRRELCFEMHRWFDLRRYAVNTQFPFEKDIRHLSYAYNNSERYVQGYYELKPYSEDSATYVIPVPRDEIEFNRGSLSNEQRPARPLMR